MIIAVTNITQAGLSQSVQWLHSPQWPRCEMYDPCSNPDRDTTFRSSANPPREALAHLAYLMGIGGFPVGRAAVARRWPLTPPIADVKI